MDHTYTYKGRDVTTLNTDELREALREALLWAHNEISTLRQWQQIEAEMRRLFNDARKAADNELR